jgi:hypothetical protein
MRLKKSLGALRGDVEEPTTKGAVRRRCGGDRGLRRAWALAPRMVPSGTTRNPSELPSQRRLKALRLLRKLEKAKYQSIKLVAIVEQMIERADLGLMADTFEAEKKALREWLRTQSMPSIRGKRKNEGQLPKPSTFDKNINSLQPIYQELFESMPSKLAANSEVIAAA